MAEKIVAHVSNWVNTLWCIDSLTDLIWHLLGKLSSFNIKYFYRNKDQIVDLLKFIENYKLKVKCYLKLVYRREFYIFAHN